MKVRELSSGVRREQFFMLLLLLEVKELNSYKFCTKFFVLQ